ncbi:hypothetical protein CsSME_00004313 [Camellia sinensis var. sinensis]
MVWICPSSKGLFSVSSYYGVLVVYVDAVSFPWKCVWVSGTPSKVAFFVWTATLGRILTIDNLIRREHILVNWCCLCCGDIESVDHLLVHCSVTSRLWMLIIPTFGLVQLGSVLAVLQSWAGGRVGRRRRKAWMIASHCLMWLIWLERNRHVFQEVSHSISWLKRWVFMVLYNWVTGLVHSDVLAYVNFVGDSIA